MLVDRWVSLKEAGSTLNMPVIDCRVGSFGEGCTACHEEAVEGDLFFFSAGSFSFASAATQSRQKSEKVLSYLEN